MLAGGDAGVINLVRVLVRNRGECWRVSSEERNQFKYLGNSHGLASNIPLLTPLCVSLVFMMSTDQKGKIQCRPNSNLSKAWPIRRGLRLPS
jgi:hypothetical protein